MIAQTQSAAAASNYGGGYVNNPSLTLRGIRGNIEYTALTIPSGDIAIVRVAAQLNGSGGNGLIQTGYGGTNNGTAGLDECGARTGPEAFYEYQLSNGNYECFWLDGVSGTDHRYTVERVNEGSSTTWAAFVDGDEKTPYDTDVGFDEAGIIIFGGEYNHSGGAIAPGGTENACWGCTGTLLGRTANVGGDGYVDIHTVDGTLNSDGDWKVIGSDGDFTVCRPKSEC
jgi:hypothetical protein